MMKGEKMKKCFYSVLIAVLVLSGTVISGLILSTPQPAFSEAPEPQCVCAECGYACGSGHATTCSSYRPK